jgi:N-acetylglucosamine-6-phosphate deacetylase
MSTHVLVPQAAALPGGLRTGVAVRVVSGIVEQVGEPAQWPDDPHTQLAGTLLPGALDLQVNGAGGRGVDEATPEALDVVARAVLEGGATSFLPTLISAPFDVLLEQVRRVASWIDTWTDVGARPLGMHVEGPFLELPGAHPPSALTDPTQERVDALLAAAEGHLSVVTLAPGRSGAAEATRRLIGAGTRVSLGHAGDATAFDACVDAGANLVTHLFNAMSPIHHRDRGIALAAVDDARLTCGLIADGHHVSAEAMRLAWRALGRERLALVTDSGPAAGAGDGSFQLGNVRVHAEGGVVRDAAGRLAGSAALMRDVVRAFGSAVPGLDGSDWAHLCAVTPAAALGRSAAIEPGAEARFSVLGTDGGLEALVP